MRSLYWKLGGALLLIVLVSVGLTAYLANVSTGREFQAYLQQGTTMYARNVSDSLGQFYAEHNNWSGIQDILPGLLRSSSDRLAVANDAGVVVGDTGKVWQGRKAADVGLTGGTPILVSGQSAGTLYLLATGAGGGRGYMGGRGGMRQMMTNTPEQNFLTGINRFFVIVGVIAAVIALLLGLFLTSRILKPICALTTGASRIASGDLKYRAKVDTKDELGTLAQSFNSMASSLERGEEARRQLNADIAHELRTPLTIIEGTVDGIIDGVFQPDKERLNAIKGQTTLLTRLIGDLRDLSLIEAGQIKLELKPADLADLVRRKITEIEVAAHEKGITLDFHAPGGLPKILADSSRMEQVMSNLLANALRHTPTGGNIVTTVHLEGAPDPKHGIASHHLVVSVKDTGEGIPAESLPHIFERFYRVDSSRSRREGGTGLGLAIVKQLVEAHGGVVWVESELGKGSTFYLAVPAQDKEAKYGCEGS
jgi:two-component system OmpR family sensor kinase